MIAIQRSSAPGKMSRWVLFSETQTSSHAFKLCNLFVQLVSWRNESKILSVINSITKVIIFEGLVFVWSKERCIQN